MTTPKTPKEDGLTPMQHYDDLTLQTADVQALASLLNSISEIDTGEFDAEIVLGCGAIGRVIIEKIERIEAHAKALKGAAR